MPADQTTRLKHRITLNECIAALLEEINVLIVRRRTSDEAAALLLDSEILVLSKRLRLLCRINADTPGMAWSSVSSDEVEEQRINTRYL